MKKRNVLAVIFLPIITLGIYALYWFVKTKGELNQKGATIPTAWLLIVPFVNIWWIWKYYEGVDHVTNSKVNGVLMFVLDIFVTSLIPMAICQDAYNKMDGTIPTMPVLPQPEEQPGLQQTETPVVTDVPPASTDVATPEETKASEFVESTPSPYSTEQTPDDDKNPPAVV